MRCVPVRGSSGSVRGSAAALWDNGLRGPGSHTGCAHIVNLRPQSFTSEAVRTTIIFFDCWAGCVHYVYWELRVRRGWGLCNLHSEDGNLNPSLPVMCSTLETASLASDQRWPVQNPIGNKLVLDDSALYYLLNQCQHSAATLIMICSEITQDKNVFFLPLKYFWCLVLNLVAFVYIYPIKYNLGWLICSQIWPTSILLGHMSHIWS